MYRMSSRFKPLEALIGLAVCTSMGSAVQAGGFALIEHGASGLGTAYAGAAALSNDGSTVWFNAAGISELENREISVTLHALNTSTTWTDRGTTLGAAFGSSVASGPDTAEPGTTTPLPNFYYAAPINQQWSYGLSIGVPFGSSTEYDNNWKGRYTTVKSSLNVVDINPALSYRLSDKVRLGFGVSLQRLTAELGSAVDSGAVCLGLLATDNPPSYTQADCFNVGLTPGNQANDGYAEISGDSTAVGFNLGALFLPKPGIKIGVAYRHSVDHELDGDADFNVNANLQQVLQSNTSTDPISQGLTQGIFRDVPASAKVELPAMFSISGAWQFNDKVQLLSDITWTGWSSFQELRVEYDNPAQRDTLSVQEWEDVFRYSVGLNYQQSSKLTLRAGIALDEEAIPSAQRRTARIPGNDRTWLTVGAGYRASDRLSFDIGYAHLTLDETPIDNSDPESMGTGQVVRGEFDSHIDILSAQLNWEFK